MSNRYNFLKTHYNYLLNQLLNGPYNSASTYLKQFYQKNRSLGSKDRFFLNEMINLNLRNYYYFKELNKSLELDSFDFLLLIIVFQKEILRQFLTNSNFKKAYIMAKQITKNSEYPYKDKLSQYFEVIEKAINNDKEQILTFFEKKEYSNTLVSKLSDTFSLPKVYLREISHLFDLFNDEKVNYEFLNSLNNSAPLFIRNNSIDRSANKIKIDFENENITLVDTILDDAFIVDEKKTITNTRAYSKGEIEIQDLSSQLVGLFLNPKRNELILDACAGAAGKSIHLAYLSKDMAHIDSYDISNKRLDSAKPRLAKKNFSSISLKYDPNELEYNYDKVLIDAPCTGSGTIRRNPLMKFKLTDEMIKYYIKKQRSILSENVKRLRKGGLLVYSTCSLFYSENTENNDFIINELGLESFKINPNLVKDLKFVSHRPNELYITPNFYNSDGFYIAMFIKN